MLATFFDTETDGLRKEATKMHCIALAMTDGRRWLGCNEPWFRDGGVDPKGEQWPHKWGDVIPELPMPSGGVWKNVYLCSIEEALEELAKADLRVGHNSQDFDERVTRKLYPWYDPPAARCMDTVLLWRLLYPMIAQSGPNTHKVPPKLRNAVSLKAIGYRLNNPKDDFDAGDWQTCSVGMVLYMAQDVDTLITAFQWAMKQGIDPRAVQVEHEFAAVIRRQEEWGFTVDYENMLVLQADLSREKARLEMDLVETFGEWWEGGKECVPKNDRAVKLTEFPDVTLPRFNAKGERMKKDYVGPPKCHYHAGSKYTPIKRVTFNPGSRDHVIKMLKQRYGWRPRAFTKTGLPKVDDAVLRALDYPEAPALADYFETVKIGGYVSEGAQAWLRCAVQEGDEYRAHGRMNTIGTYTYRCSHYKPNTGQVPTRSEKYGHRCRTLFTARNGFKLVGFDGSGMQLRLLAHYLSFFDKGEYLRKAFMGTVDAHEFMRDSVGTDLMGEGAEGRSKGKTMNYALCFGGGVRKLGSIVRPHASEKEQQAIGLKVKERMLPHFGAALDDLKAALADSVQEKGYIIGLDGRRARVPKANAALATLLQMGEAVVMKKALVILDNGLQEAGLRCGILPSGEQRPIAEVDYEFCANVHDEAQADVREEALDVYTDLALECVTSAGKILGVRCPLKSDVKVGMTWADTH